MNFEGVFSVLPTPFTADGAVDFTSLRNVVDLYIAAGINGLTALGVTSEVARLNEVEREQILACVIEQVNGRVPVVAGASADGTRACVEFCSRACSMGAKAVMVSPPRLAKLNSEAVLRHYKTLADSVGTSIVVQDFPPTSGYFLEPALLARIAREVPVARTIKLEDPPTPFKTARILAQTEGIEVAILGGLGGVYLLEELISGAAGVMTGFAYPEILVEVVRRFKSGDLDGASDIFYSHVALMRFEFQENIGMAIRKEVLRRRGVVAEAGIRLPGGELDKHTRLALDRLLAWIHESSDLNLQGTASVSQSQGD